MLIVIRHIEGTVHENDTNGLRVHKRATERGRERGGEAEKKERQRARQK